MEIYRIKTRLVNTYLVVYPQQLLVVDVATGCEPQVLGFIAHELGRDIRDVALVVCTHDDPDHMGGVMALAGATGARVGRPYAAGVTWRKLLRDPTSLLVRPATAIREAFRPRAREMYANPARDQAALAQPRVELGVPVTSAPDVSLLKNNQRLPGFPDWQVLHTPGHSWDSLCFYHADSGSLISGDTLLASAKQNALVLPAIYANPWQMRRSLKRLARLPVTAVFPGHGTPLSGDGLIDALLRKS